jgi:hypothetical protein
MSFVRSLPLERVGRVPAADELERATVELTGLDDFGDRSYRPALEALTEALNREARLSPGGVLEASQTIRGALTTRLYLQDQGRWHPEIDGVDLGGPLFVIGLPRTGSSFLHALLSRHIGLRAPLLWELMYPVTPPGMDTAELVARTRRFVVDYYREVPGLRRIFQLDALEPDECKWILTNEFHNDVFGLGYRVPSYSKWLLWADATSAYLGHRQQLRHIWWRQPSGVPLLKCPSHVHHLQALMKAYPDAGFVVLHRRPTDAIASACSLAANVRRKRSNHHDPLEVGQQVTEMAAHAFSQLLDLATTKGPARGVVHVRYTDLVGDPLKTAERIFDFFGLPTDQVTLRSVATFIAANPRHKNGTHDYSATAYGLDDAAIRERFSPYIDAFL